jgi:hypothetical protein
MSDRFEAGEARVQVQPSALPVMRRAVVLVGLLFYANVHYTPLVAIQHVIAWLGGNHAEKNFAINPGDYWLSYWYLVENVLALAVHVAIFVVAGSLAMGLLRRARAGKAAPRGPVAVRADAAGLHADDRLLVARGDVTAVDVAVDADIGFALVVQTRDGATTRVPFRSESDARALAAVLAPSRAEDGALLFEGVSHRRWGETLRAVGAVAAVGVADPLARWGVWPMVRFVVGPNFDERHPLLAAATELGVEGLCISGILALAVLALGPVLRRLRPGRVTLDRAGMALGEGRAARRIAREDITRVDVDDSPEVKLALRDGRAVRLRFSADRPVVERDAFAARVRAIMAETPIETYSAAETSGVRVALNVDDPEREEEPEADLEAQAPRARRR